MNQLNENRTLQKIQKIAKIARILSIIGFAGCIIGGIGCILGFGILAVLVEGISEIDGVVLKEVIEETAHINMMTIYTACIVGMICCFISAIAPFWSMKYFKHELEAGTPFTFEGAIELRRLGIITIITSILAQGLAIGAIEASGILFNTDMYMNSNIQIDNGGAVILGVAFIIFGLVCRYGAEVTGRNEKTN